MTANILETEAPDATPAVTFGAVYEAHFDYVWHSVRRLGGRTADQEDLVHDVFVTFMRTVERFDPTRPVKPWLFGITFRVVSDYRRRGSFKREVPVAEIDQAASQGDPSSHLEATRRRELVMKALEFLSNDERAILVMVELQGHSVVEAARVLEANENTLYSRLRSARKTLTAALVKLGAVGETP